MSWTPPLTWTNGLLVAASILNQQIRDNLRYLKGQLGAIHLENAVDLQEIAPPASPATGRARIWNTNVPFRQMLYARFSDGTQRRMTHYAAIASRSTVFSHSGGNVWQTIPLPTLDHSSHSNLTLHNGTGLVVPETGVYVVSGSFSLDGTVSNSLYGGIAVDTNTNILAFSGAATQTSWFSVTVSSILFLSAGQIVFLVMYAGGATSTTGTARLGMVSI